MIKDPLWGDSNWAELKPGAIGRRGESEFPTEGTVEQCIQAGNRLFNLKESKKVCTFHA